MYVQGVQTKEHARKANKQHCTYTWLSLTFLSPWLTSSVSSFQTLMPSFLFRSWETLILLARTCLRVCISSSTWNRLSLFSHLRIFQRLTFANSALHSALCCCCSSKESPWSSFAMLSDDGDREPAEWSEASSPRTKGKEKKLKYTIAWRSRWLLRRISFLADRLRFNTLLCYIWKDNTHLCTLPKS